MQPLSMPGPGQHQLRIVGAGQPEQPHDAEAEQAVIGSVLLNSESLTLVSSWLRPERFYLAKHRQIYQCIIDLAAGDTPPDLITIVAELRRRDQLDGVGGIMYLTELSRVVPVSSRIAHYALQVEQAGWLRDIIAMGGKIAALGYDTTQPAGAIASQVEHLIAKTLTTRAHGPAPRTYHINELWSKEFPPLTHLIPSLLVEGVTLFSGKPKMGKSLLTMGIAAAIAAGGVALGAAPVEHAGDVLYLLLEDPEAGLQERLETILQGRPDIPFYYQTSWPTVSDGGVEQLAAWLAEHPAARLIVVDTFTAIAPDGDTKKSAYRADYDALRPLQRLAAAHPGLSIIVNTHSRKGDATDVLDEVSGTTGKTGAIDHVWVMRRVRGEHTAELHYALRRGGGEGSRMLTFDQQLICWTLGGDASEARQTKLRLDMLDALSDGGQYPKDLAELLEAPAPKVRQQLQVLKRQDLVKQNERNQYVLTDAGRSWVLDQSDRSDRSDRDDRSDRRSHLDTSDADHPDWSDDDQQPAADGSEQTSMASVISDHSDQRDHRDHSDHQRSRLVEQLLAPIPPARRFFTRRYLAGTAPSDQRRARSDCQQFDVDYAAAWRAVNNSSSDPPPLDD